MTGKERFMIALEHKQPDRIPFFDFLFMPELFEHVIGVRPEVYNAEDAVKLSLALGLDAVWIPSDGFAGYSPKSMGGNQYQDEWGTVYETSLSVSGPIDAPVAYPISDWEDFRNWTCPNPHDLHRTKSVREAIQMVGDKIAVMGGVLGPLTNLYFLMGTEEGSVASILEPDLFHAIMRCVTDYNIAAGLHLIEAGVDAVIISDDLGYNSGTFLNIDAMRTMVIPYLREMVYNFKKAGSKVMLHCDGNMTAIMPEFVSIGMDAWQPLERKAHNDLKFVKDTYGHLITPVGNVDSSEILPYGTKEDVRRDVIQCMRLAGEGGGYVIGSDHSLHDGIPVENIMAMVDAIHTYGEYPLRLPKKNEKE